jgi:hypothetical protein
MRYILDMNSKKEKINYRDISIVVQGAIAGLPNDKEKDRHTYLCLKSIRKILPGAKIILSTWEKDNVEGLDCDLLVRSQDPGNANFDNLSPFNCFRQIVSSINGLKKCTTKYAAKVRSDLIFKNDNFLKYFIKFSDLPSDENYRLLKQRVIMFPGCNPNRRMKFPFHPSDWFFFGLTEDVQDIFDIPLIRKNLIKKDADGISHEVDSLLRPEQFIWFSLLSKYRKIPFEYANDVSHGNIVTSEKYFANNAILITPRRAGIDSLKWPGTVYMRTPALSYAGFYTFTDYKRMLNKYAHANLIIVPNPIEEITYFVVYNLRFFLKEKFPKVQRFLNRFNKEDVGRIKIKTSR